MSLSFIRWRFRTLDSIAGFIEISFTGVPKLKTFESVSIFILERIFWNKSVVWVASGIIWCPSMTSFHLLVFNSKPASLIVRTTKQRCLITFSGESPIVQMSRNQLLNLVLTDLVISSTSSENSASPNGSPCWMLDRDMIKFLLKNRLECSW